MPIVCETKRTQGREMSLHYWIVAIKSTVEDQLTHRDGCVEMQKDWGLILESNVMS